MTPESPESDDWKPGFVVIDVQNPDWHLSFCDPDGCKTSYFLKPTPEGWMVMSWAGWGVEDVDP